TRTLGATPLIVSVDCGITAVEPARVARESGADLIITDHHEFDPAALPNAYALVHPRLGAWSEERGARSVERGAWSVERGAWSDSKSEPPAPQDKTRDTGHGTRDKTQETQETRDTGHGTRDTSYPFPDLCGAG